MTALAGCDLSLGCVYLNETALRQTILRLGGTIEEVVILKEAVAVGDGTVIPSNNYIVQPVGIDQNYSIGYDVSTRSVHRRGHVAEHGAIIESHFSDRSGEATVNIERKFPPGENGTMIGNGRVVSRIILGNFWRIREMQNIRENVLDNGWVVWRLSQLRREPHKHAAIPSASGGIA